MSWGQLRKQIREFLCPALAKRIDFHITSYHRDNRNTDSDRRFLGRGWITLDGKEILTFSGKAVHWAGPGSATPESEDQDNPADRQDLYEAVKVYPQTSIDDALGSASFVVRGIAMADRRLGKRRLAAIDVRTEHPFVQMLHNLRCEVEGIPLATRNSTP